MNLDGEVIGMNTLIRMGAGGAYGFAVPINEVRRVAQALLTDGKVRYAYLGVTVRDLDAADESTRKTLGRGAPEKGAYVEQVSPDGSSNHRDVFDSTGSHIGQAVEDSVSRESNSRRRRLGCVRSGADSR